MARSSRTPAVRGHRAWHVARPVAASRRPGRSATSKHVRAISTSPYSSLSRTLTARRKSSKSVSCQQHACARKWRNGRHDGCLSVRIMTDIQTQGRPVTTFIYMYACIYTRTHIHIFICVFLCVLLCMRVRVYKCGAFTGGTTGRGACPFQIKDPAAAARASSSYSDLVVAGIV